LHKNLNKKKKKNPSKKIRKNKAKTQK